MYFLWRLYSYISYMYSYIENYVYVNVDVNMESNESLTTGTKLDL